MLRTSFVAMAGGAPTASLRTHSETLGGANASLDTTWRTA
jgi:hypothetical protein